ncbi:hypothetical protein SteCoe_32795 [Stentor coeruleus]|uniref:Rab-GAP TBC domain-containing protein n=1 Tax=Stentor coeruleus TaxID=5963 RepID=A0A1R2AY75_9CILI|nr:hypothetical protein SteCoe_32795 [Stentor coeruleus]
MLLAQTEEQCEKKTHILKDICEKVATSETKISDLSREIQSLLKSINELIVEKNSYRDELEQNTLSNHQGYSSLAYPIESLISLSIFTSKEQKNKENKEQFRSLDQFLIIQPEINGIDIWTSLLSEADSPQVFKKMKKLSRQGIPTKIRGELWTRVIGNDLFITPKLFTSLLKTSQNANKTEKEGNGTLLIPMDLKRTLSNLQVFQEKQPLHSSLSDLLKAFASYRPDIGYVQGMAYLGAIFILHQNTYSAFTSFSNLIFKSHMLKSFYSFDLPVMQEYYKVFEYYMKKKIPNVFKKFKDLEITPDMFLLEWVYTLFSRFFEIEYVSRIMSLFILSDDSFIIRFGLAILIFLSKKLADENMDAVAMTINNMVMHLEYYQILRISEKIKIKIADINKLRIVLA